MKPLSAIVLLSLFFLAAWLAPGCSGGNEGYSVIVQFPNPAQAYKDATQTLNISVMSVENNATCQDLLAGVHNPDDDGYQVIDSESISTPFTEHVPPLKVLKKDTRTRLLFIEGKDSNENILLRGCIEINPKDNLHTLTVSLGEACPIGIYCTSICQNAVLEPGETCDNAIAAGQAGACPTQCDDGNNCTSDKLQNAGTCQAACMNTPITECIRDDGCCPEGANCNNNTDNDCPVVCGNGAVEAGETCDTAIPAGQAGACPTSCDDGNKCTTDTLVSGGPCQASCDYAPIVPCCGNGVVEAGETCDPPNGTTCPEFCSTTCNDITGTWIARLTVKGDISLGVPVGIQPNADIDVVQRLVVTKSESNLNTRFDICSLATSKTCTPADDPNTCINFSVAYPAGTIATLTANGSGPDTCYHFGDIVNIPSFVINVGWTAPFTPTTKCPSLASIPSCPPPITTTPVTCTTGGNTVIDSDRDGYYGVWLPMRLEVLSVCAAGALTIQTNLSNMRLTDATTNSGVINFPTSGYVFQNNIGAYAIGPITVTPPTDVPITLIKLAGDVPCAEVVTHCTGATCVP